MLCLNFNTKAILHDWNLVLEYRNIYCNGTLTAAYIYIHRNTYCNEILTANNALNLSSTFTQCFLNLFYDSATAAYIYIHGNTYRNRTLTASNALTPNSTFNGFSIWNTIVPLQHICPLIGTPIAMEPLQWIMH